MTLTAFLLARIAEDEAVARAALTDEIATWSQQDWIEIDDPSLTHVRRHDPHRVLAESGAKRRIVEDEHGVDVFGGCSTCADGAHLDSMDDEEEGSVLVALVDYAGHPCTTLRLLALPYADHPDYQQEWRP